MFSKNRIITSLFWLLPFIAYSHVVVAGGQMLVTEQEGTDTVLLDFIADPNDPSFFNSLTPPAGCDLAFKPGSTSIMSCEVPKNINNQYTADYIDSTGSTQVIGFNGQPPVIVDPDSPVGAVLEALNNECASPQASQELLARCEKLPYDRTEAANAIVPTQLTAQTGQVIKISRGQMQNIRMRMDRLHRKITEPVSINLNGKALPLEGGAGAGDDSEGLMDGRLGVFINGRFQLASKSKQGYETGFDSDTSAVTAGVDYRFADNLIMGVAIGYDNTDTRLHDDRGNQEINAITGLYYGTYDLPDEMYINWGAAYGGLDYNSIRRISYLQNDGTQFTGETYAKPEADQFSLTAGFGKDFSFDAWRLTPIARIDYTEINIDASREQGNTGFESFNGAQNAQSLATSTGLKLAYAYSLPWGVVMPEINMEWQHEFLNNSTRMLGTLGNSTIYTQTNGPDRDYFNLGGSIVGTFAEGRSAFINYESRLGQATISSHTVQVGVRIPF